MDGETEAELSENGELWVCGMEGVGDQGHGNFLSHVFSFHIYLAPSVDPSQKPVETHS